MKRNDCIVVTGANGLAGSAVVEHLRNGEFTSVIPLTRKDVDLRNHRAVCDLFQTIKPRYLFHSAACVYGLGGNMANQGKSILENTLINTAVVEAARSCGSVQKIIVMGTNAAYPWPTELPFKEENLFNGRPDDGEFAYGHAKRHMLAMLECYRQSYGTEYCYLVSGNLYGPRDTFDVNTGHVLPSLIAKFHTAKSTGGPVSIWGDGSATRDFLYVKDLARIVQLHLSDDIKSGAINIGSGQRVSIRHIVEMLSAISGVDEGRVQYDTTKPTGRPDCYSDLSRISALGFTPAYDIAQGLRETWDWFDNSKKAA
jgi:GDP-L-fucose synthase